MMDQSGRKSCEKKGRKIFRANDRSTFTQTVFSRPRLKIFQQEEEDRTNALRYTRETLENWTYIYVSSSLNDNLITDH